jgi:hypothetical protein
MFKRLIKWLYGLCFDIFPDNTEEYNRKLSEMEQNHQKELAEYRTRLQLWTSRMHGRCPPEWLNELHQCDKWVKK